MGKSNEMSLDLREAESFATTKESPVNDEISRRVIPIHLTKSASEGNAEMIADLVRSGNYNALDVATKIKWMIATLEQAGKLIQEDAVIEIEKHSGKTTVNGAEVIKKEVGTKYDYSGCNDSSWNALSKLESQAKEKKSEREKFLKTLPSSMTVADEETGEMITLNPPIKSSTTSIAVTFK